MEMPWFARGYLVLVNIVSFVAFVYDKICALRSEWRVPERRLHLLTISGGVFGSSFAMLLAKHKISKPVFSWMLFVGYLTAMLIFVLSGAHRSELSKKAENNMSAEKSDKHNSSADKYRRNSDSR